MADRTLVDARKVAVRDLGPGDIVGTAPVPCDPSKLVCPATVSSTVVGCCTVDVRFTSGARATWPAATCVTVLDLAGPLEAKTGRHR